MHCASRRTNARIVHSRASILARSPPRAGEKQRKTVAKSNLRRKSGRRYSVAPLDWLVLKKGFSKRETRWFGNLVVGLFGLLLLLLTMAETLCQRDVAPSRKAHSAFCCKWGTGSLESAPTTRPARLQDDKFIIPSPSPSTSLHSSSSFLCVFGYVVPRLPFLFYCFYSRSVCMVANRSDNEPLFGQNTSRKAMTQ